MRSALGALLLALVACGGGGGGVDAQAIDAPHTGSNHDAGVDAPKAHDAAIDAFITNTVTTVNCGSGSAAAVVTAKTFAYTSTPAGSASNDSAIKAGDVVEFNLMPSTDHPVQPFPAGGETDSGIHAPDNAVTCLKFPDAGKFHYDCMVHGASVQGTVTVTQ